ncbi:MAG: hypothetical protein ACR2FQ_12970, partial [Pseudonocardiaceae bacterium]
ARRSAEQPGRDVVWKISDDLAVDLTRHPGQQVLAQMVGRVSVTKNRVRRSRVSTTVVCMIS